MEMEPCKLTYSRMTELDVAVYQEGSNITMPLFSRHTVACTYRMKAKSIV